MNDKIIKMEIVAWAVFIIPSAYIIFGLYSLYSFTTELGDEVNLILFVGPFFNIVALFFAGRFFAERAKHKMHAKESERLRNLLYKDYPERLEDLEQ